MTASKTTAIQSLRFEDLVNLEGFTTYTSLDTAYIKVGNTSAMSVEFNNDEPPRPILVKTRFKKSALVIRVVSNDEVGPMLKAFILHGNKLKTAVRKALPPPAICEPVVETKLAVSPAAGWPFPKGENMPASGNLTSAPPSTPQVVEPIPAVVTPSKIEPKKGSILRKAKKKPAKKAAPKVKVAAKKAK